jgi:hypothetical protein
METWILIALGVLGVIAGIVFFPRPSRPERTPGRAGLGPSASNRRRPRFVSRGDAP